MKKLSLLFALTLFSSVFSFARTYDGNEKIYLRPLAVDWWLNGSAKVGLYFFTGTNNTFVEAFRLVDNNGDNIWSATVPAGNWTYVIVTRHSASPISWGNKWNQTGNILIDATANYIYSFTEKSTTAIWQTLKAHYRSKGSGNWSDLSTWIASFDTNWTNSSNYFDAHVIPNNNDSSVTIMEAHKVTADNTNTVSSLTIKSTGELTINSGKQLTITGTATNNGTINNNGTIKLLSNGTDGTATLVGDVGGSAEVHQSVTGFRTYYLGSPVSTVTALSGITGVSTFNVSTDKWVTPIVVTDLEAKINENGVGIGFLGQVLGTETTDISLTGTLNTGTKPVTLVTDATKKFNFLGNPYPSYLNAKLLVEGNSTVEQSIWYRTQTDASTYSFVTYNVPANITTPAPTSGNHGFIPPMQGFWVKASGTETGFSFTNAMRTHNTTAENIPLKAPQAAVNQILRLQVTNGTALDEAVMLFNENAQNGYDSYDAAKMINTGTGALNIYTVLGTEKLVLNSQPEITYGVEIPVGMNLAAGTYTVSANEFSNFAEGTKAQLLDKVSGTVTDLTTGDYTFTLTETLNSNTRFALVFPQNTPTGVDNAGAGDVTVFTRSNRIVVTANEAAQGSMIYVFNGVGQRLAAQAVSGTVNEIGRTFPAGVYIVKVNNVTAKVVVK